MKHLKEIIEVILDKLILLVSIILKASKINLLKVKVTLAILIFGLFSWNYFIKVKVVSGKLTEFSVETPPNNVPPSVLLMLVVLCIYLVQVDVIQIKRRENLRKEIAVRNDISESVKIKLLEEL